MTQKYATLDYKIAGFEPTSPGESFPEFWILTEEENRHIRSVFAQHIGMPHYDEEKERAKLVDTLFQMATRLEEFDTQDEDTGFEVVLKAVGVEPSSTGYIDWHWFDDMNAFRFTDLVQYYRDIRYEEDIGIFDDTFSWILFVTHYWEYRFLKFASH